MQRVDIYIDGSCSPNPGPVGWCAVCQIDGKIFKVDGFDADPEGTNNQGELRGAIGGLKALKKPCEVVFHTDSNYLITCVKHNDAWLTNESRANSALWLEFITVAKKGGHKIKFVKVKGHSGDKLNEIADKYAKARCREAKHALLKR